jgi:transcriptional regulator with XRE-family HTH domain
MSEYDLKEFGTRIRTIRKALKLNQEEFGEKLGISKSFISNIEKGISKAGYDLFFFISKVYDVNLYYIVHGEGEMFGKKREIPGPSLGDKSFGEQVETGNELLWYVEHSPLFKHAVMAYASKYIYENIEILERDIKIKSSKEKKQD